MSDATHNSGNAHKAGGSHTYDFKFVGYDGSLCEIQVQADNYQDAADEARKHAPTGHVSPLAQRFGRRVVANGNREVQGEMK